MIFYGVGKLAWRFELAAAFVPAVPLCILIWWVPESPRWLLKKQRYSESFSSFCRLRHTPLQAARDLYSAHVQVELEKETVSASSYGKRFVELFTIPRVRRATLGAFIVMIGQQMCGINIMAFYSSTIFSEAGYSTKQALAASLGFGAVNTLFALPAVKTIDTFGRRSLLLFTFPNMAWCLFAAGATFTMSTDNAARVPLLAFFIYLFTAFYCEPHMRVHFRASMLTPVFYSTGDGPCAVCVCQRELPPLAPRDGHGVEHLCQQLLLDHPQSHIPLDAQDDGAYGCHLLLRRPQCSGDGHGVPGSPRDKTEDVGRARLRIRRPHLSPCLVPVPHLAALVHQALDLLATQCCNPSALPLC